MENKINEYNKEIEFLIVDNGYWCAWAEDSAIEDCRTLQQELNLNIEHQLRI